jgi:hypothetical protein
MEDLKRQAKAWIINFSGNMEVMKFFELGA